MENLTTVDTIFTLTTCASLLGIGLVLIWLTVCTVLYAFGILSEDRKESLFKMFEVGAGMAIIMGCLSVFSSFFY